LYPAADLIQEIEAALGNRHSNGPQSDSRENSSPRYTNGTSNGSDAAGEETSATRRRSSAQQSQPNGSASSEKSRTASPVLEYSQEQVEAVRKIKKCKDYYQILGIEKDAAEIEIKRAYKKLALQFHPDKNNAPGAADAFKMIGNAFAVLSDPQKKRQYDLHGPDDQLRSNARTYDRYYTNDYTRGFEAEISPEDLFNLFFGGGNMMYNNSETQFRRQRYQRTGGQHHTHTTHEAGGYGVILQMMPVIILITLSLMSSFFVSEPAFSLVRNK
jgi:DnaJ family protein B protein 12